MKQIHRSWVAMRGPAPPALPPPPTQPQCARREKRHCDDIFIGRSVAVPADSSTRRILRHQELFKRPARYATARACNVGERQKVIGNARICARFWACEDIPLPKGVYAAIALMAVKFEGLQRQLFESLNEALFVGGRYYIRDIAETGRQLRLPEQAAHAADGTAGGFWWSAFRGHRIWRFFLGTRLVVSGRLAAGRPRPRSAPRGSGQERRACLVKLGQHSLAPGSPFCRRRRRRRGGPRTSSQYGSRRSESLSEADNPRRR